MEAITLDRTLDWNALRPCALYLDVDGTLLDIAPTPDAVEVPPGLTAALAVVARGLGGALALVSGRTLAALDRLFRPLSVAAVGIHGAEVRTAGDPPRTADYLARQLDGIRAELTARIAEWPGAFVEDKGPALALHHRASRIDERIIGRAMAALAELAGPEFVLLHGKRVFELKPAALSKATGIAALHGTAAFAGRTPVCIGDDLTDESAFAYANQAGGLSIRVGRTDAAGSATATAARFCVDSPGEVRAWLARLASGMETAP
ncbi:MAG: Trehalose-6-phosphate phosphatase [Steroidobacteraceae bacterium]|nr:Trehalose-6-phosphate phosphatase [Steroidobacteraceae bacterium]